MIVLVHGADLVHVARTLEWLRRVLLGIPALRVDGVVAVGQLNAGFLPVGLDDWSRASWQSLVQSVAL